MCLGCGRIWTIVHVLWSVVYVTCGAAQLVAGIFFIISLPELHLSCNIWTGSWNIIVGITIGMIACFGRVSSRRQEVLLYLAASILAANAVDAVLTEWCFYWVDFPKLLANRPYQILIHHACFTTRIAIAAVIITSFLDTQLAFCSMQTTRTQNKSKLRRSHEQVSDIEYIIPRTKSTKPYSAYNDYSQSWVFDSETANTSSNNISSPYLKLPQNGTPKSFIESSPVKEIEEIPQKDTSHLIDNPVVQIEEASDDSTSNSDRKLNYMKSFSRSASPVILSVSSSQLSLNASSSNNPPIYECLERLTEASVYRSRLNSALSNKEEDESQYQYQSPQQSTYRKVEALTPQGEKVHYASLMKELQKAIGNKKDISSSLSASESTTASERTQTSSKCSSKQEPSQSNDNNSDAEFSKELEAALQLIQDLESPTTVETTSEPKSSQGEKENHQLAVWRNSDASDSDKTLSAVGSLAEITSPVTECHPELCTFKPSVHGKGARVVVHCDSESTSGYSSPTQKSNTHTPNWSTASSVNSSNTDLGSTTLSYSIQNTKSAAVISLYSQDTLKSKDKSVTLVNISKEDDPIYSDLDSNSLYLTKNDLDNNNYKSINSKDQPDSKIVIDNNDFYKYVDYSKVLRRSSSGTGAVWNVKSILRKKKQQGLPKLCPELEGAIVKSESLAYLSELELLARHQRNKDIEREIEQRVFRVHQLESTKTESNC